MKRTLSTLTIELKIQGNTSDVVSIVDAVLDEGVLQDAINEYDAINEKPSVRVRSVVVKRVQRENPKRKK